MTKYEFLRLLDDNEIQRKLLKIVDDSKNSSRIEVNSALEDENSRLKNNLRQAEYENTLLQTKLSEYQKIFNDEHKRAQSLQQSLDTAQRKISELEAALQQRFSLGWTLFEKYQSISAHSRQLLTGVFTRADFMSFICGGAQVESLEKIWDVLRECTMNYRRQDSEILWGIFEYCLELVNSSRTQASYSVLPVNVGDNFDSEFHAEAPGSRAQGKVSNVYLRGYRNDYNGRIIRKSIVQVS